MGTGDGHKDENGRLFHGGGWRVASSWPLEGTAPTALYLHAGGRLSAEPPADEGGASTYTFDPDHPVPTIGGAFSGALKRGGYDQRERTFRSLRGGSENGFYGSEVDGRRTADRPDVLVFESEPLREAVEVVGPIAVRLWVSSSAVDTDFTAKLIDVDPDGTAYNLTEGLIRARFRNSVWEPPTLLTPGEIYQFTLELCAVHQCRVKVRREHEGPHLGYARGELGEQVQSVSVG